MGVIWIILRQPTSSTTRQALSWNKQGKRESGDVQEPPVDGGYWVEL